MYPIRVRCPYLLAVHSMRVSPQRVLCECRFPPLGCLFICIDWLGIFFLTLLQVFVSTINSSDLEFGVLELHHTEKMRRYLRSTYSIDYQMFRSTQPQFCQPYCRPTQSATFLIPSTTAHWPGSQPPAPEVAQGSTP